jgi:putative PIN family toxin of toxin-antitoxin system
VTRLVIDASVLVSAIASRGEGNPWLVLQAVRSGQIEMVTCEHLLAEVERALTSRYFAERITAAECTAALDALRALADVHPDPVDPPTVLRDPGDDYLVALANSGGAEAIVTGDRDLLDHRGLTPPAMTARSVCEKLGLIS